MNNKWFLKGFIFSLACISVFILTYSVSFGYYGGIIPSSYESSFELGNIFSNYTFDQDFYSGLGLQTASYAENFANPYASFSNTGSYYQDMFSTAGDQSFTYSNVFGFSLDMGSYNYRDPIFVAGGEHVNVGTPLASFGSEYDYTQSIAGGSFQTGSYFDAPWTHYESEYAAGYGMSTFPYGQAAGGVSIAYGKNPMLSLNPEMSGLMSLVLSGPMLNEVGRAMGDTIMYTSEGMGFYGNPYYFNPYNPSGWYFDAGVQSSAAATP